HGTRYLGKMFNDDWMRDRHFLDASKPNAVDLVSNHKNQKLLTGDINEPVQKALEILNKYSISQIPVTDKENFVGSLNDNYLFNRLMENNEVRNLSVKNVMQPAFPIVSEKTPIEEVSKLITKDNNAVLMKDLGGNVHIITKHDIIEAIAKMS